ncbi:MAG: right-handed parallel beta-helix repeat-containing protein [Chloroflexota bacterium]|nr:right-handed parallel beta-helix repeat-containing protein [Chloroflexota bacterium]
MQKPRLFPHLALCLILVVVVVVTPSPYIARADPTIPPVWDIVTEDFESGSLDAWTRVSAGDLSLVPGGGRNGSSGLSVAVGQNSSYLYQTDIARAEEGYLTFWFDPNGVVIPDPFTWWPPGNSIRIASIVSSDTWWPPLVSIYVRYETGQGYRGFITWAEEESNHYDYENDFEIANDWQMITIGYRIDEWAAVWIDDQLVHYNDTAVSHQNSYGDVIYVGKTNENSDITPTGTMRFDDVAFQVPRMDDLWVDAVNGDDDNDGLTSGAAFQTIQKAADLAGPGTTVHVLPGVYRETVWPAMSGSDAGPATYRAENGPGTAVIRGSEPASSLAWTQLTANTIGLPASVDPTGIYYADLSAWELDGPPRFVVELDGGGEVVARLPLSREPDWHVSTEWKHHEFWWAADGGSSVAGCDPATDPDANCDYAWRSMTQLTDRTNDSDPPGIEPGNLTTLGDLTGATLVAIDTMQGHYVYRRTVAAHDVGNGRLTVDEICEHDGGSGNPGLGWGSKYYVEGKPYLLDTPGEWWYDETSGRLYLWPPTPGNPATKNIEISRRDNGFNLRNRSYTTLDGLTIEFLNGSAIYLANWSTHKSYDDIVRYATLRYANRGVHIEQSVRADAPAGNVIDGFTLEDSEIAYVDTHAIRLIDWWDDNAAPDSFTRSGVLNTVIRDNEMHHLGFRTDGDNAVGASFTFVNRLRFEGNHVHHVAHNGIQFSRSVIQSHREYDFSPDEIKTGEILIEGNIFEKACQLTTDCGALKIWGSPPDNHVFRDFLVTGNVFRNTFGWTYVSEKRGRWAGGPESDVHGMGGFGLYVDHASGVHAYRNVSYNNAYTDYMVYGRWRDGAIVYVNNVAANSLHGMSLGGGQYDTHGAVDTQVINNILVNNEAFGISLSYAAGSYANTTVDYNLYDNNGWRSYEQGGIWHAGAMVVSEGGSWDPYQTLADVQAGTPWEDRGIAGDPVFWNYDPDDHDLHDGSWPNFHLTAASANAIDQGTTALPDSLATLLDTFDVDDPRRGAAFDVGRYEAGFALLADPAAQAMNPGGVAHYSLRLDPADLPHPVTLTAASPSPFLTLTLSPTVITSGTVATLTVTDTHPSTGLWRAQPSRSGQVSGTTLLPGLWYTVPITGTGGGFTHTTNVGLLVGGARLYLPLVLRCIEKPILNGSTDRPWPTAP